MGVPFIYLIINFYFATMGHISGYCVLRYELKTKQLKTRGSFVAGLGNKLRLGIVVVNRHDFITEPLR